MQVRTIYIVNQAEHWMAHTFVRIMLTFGTRNTFSALTESSMALFWRQMTLTEVNGVH